MSSATNANNVRARVVGPRWLSRAIVVVLLLAVLVGLAYWASIPGGNVLADKLSVPLDGAKTARIAIRSDTGHLTIDGLAGGEPVLASGTLQYFEHQGLPTKSVSTDNGQAALTVRGGGSAQSFLRLPWSACGGAYEWQIHLNPRVPSDLTAYTGGGNVKLDLRGMAVSRLSAETAGGNVDVALPDNAADLNVTAKTGGGNVTLDIGNGIAGSNSVKAESGGGNVVVTVPSGIAVKVHATSGLGKVIVGPAFGQTDKNSYQSPDYDGAANRVELTLSSGAGNISVNTK